MSPVSQVLQSALIGYGLAIASVLAADAPSSDLLGSDLLDSDSLEYAALVQRLSDTHPEYVAMLREVDAAQASVDAATALPDPMFRIELMDIDRSNPRLLPGQTGSTLYTWEQMFPLWGKRGLQGEVATANVAVTKARAAQALSELRAMLRMAYSEFYAAIHGQSINNEVLGLLRDMERNAQVRYANGLTAQQDVIKAKSEQTLLLAEQQMLLGEIARACVLINSLLGQAPDTKLPPPGLLPPLTQFESAYLQLQQQQAQATPALTAAAATRQSRQAARDLAVREWYPDLTVGITSMQVDDQIESWQLMFEITLPLFGSRRAMETEASAMLASAQASHDAELRRVLGTAAQVIADYRVARNQEQLFREQLLPETELNFQSALAGYQTGKVDFGTLIEAERQIRQTRLLILAAAVKQQLAAAQFEQLTGIAP